MISLKISSAKREVFCILGVTKIALTDMSVVIKVTKQTDGFKFSLSPAYQDKVREAFPDAQPSMHITVTHDSATTVKFTKGNFVKYIHYLLLDLDDPEQLAQVGPIDFVDAKSGISLHTIDG